MKLAQNPLIRHINIPSWQGSLFNYDGGLGVQLYLREFNNFFGAVNILPNKHYRIKNYNNSIYLSSFYGVALTSLPSFTAPRLQCRGLISEGAQFFLDDYNLVAGSVQYTYQGILSNLNLVVSATEIAPTVRLGKNSANQMFLTDLQVDETVQSSANNLLHEVSLGTFDYPTSATSIKLIPNTSYRDFEFTNYNYKQIAFPMLASCFGRPAPGIPAALTTGGLGIITSFDLYQYDLLPI